MAASGSFPGIVFFAMAWSSCQKGELDHHGRSLSRCFDRIRAGKIRKSAGCSSKRKQLIEVWSWIILALYLAPERLAFGGARFAPGSSHGVERGRRLPDASLDQSLV